MMFPYLWEEIKGGPNPSVRCGAESARQADPSLRMTTSGEVGRRPTSWVRVQYPLEVVILSTAKDLFFLACSGRGVMDGLGGGEDEAVTAPPSSWPV